MTARRTVLAVAVLAIALGVFARADALGHKLLWQDEAYSLLRISGHTNEQLDALFDGAVHPASEVFALQRITPERGLRELLDSIVREEPQRGPLYYILAREWIGLAGNGTAQVRGLSVLLGIAGIGLAFGLGRQAAGSLEGGALAAALVALAPVQIRLAQQVREYVLVSDLTLLSAWFVLRAFEKPSWGRWAAYFLCAAAGAYTNVEFVFVLAFEGAAVAAFAWRGPRTQRAARLTGYAAAVLLACAAYAPWAALVAGAARRGARGVSWAATGYSLRSSLLKWAFNIGASFFDSEYAHVALGVLLLPVALLIGFALYRLVRGPGDGFVRALALALVASSALPLTLLDAVTHAHYALITRYAISTWTGLEFAVALVLAWLAVADDVRARRFAAVAAAFVFLLGASAVVLDRSFVEWWDDNEHLSERPVADAVTARPDVAIVAGANTAPYVLVLSRYLAPERRLLLVRDVPANLPAGPAYLFLPSDALRERALALAGTGATLANVSPSIGLSIPDLREHGEPQITANNALWLLQRASNRR